MATQPSELSDEQITRCTDWIRNNYQDYPSISSLCDAMSRALRQETTSAAAPREDFDKLSADLTRAKNLLVRLWDKHPDARAQIEGSTGNWFIWGTDRDASITPAAAPREELTDLYNHVYDLIQLRPDDNPTWRKDLCEVLGMLDDLRAALASTRAETIARRTAEYWKAELVAANLEIDRLRASTATPAATMTGWQSIESAPKDGRKVLLWWGEKVVYGHWLDNSQTRTPWAGWRGPSLEPMTLGQPTHWMPLPEAPGADRERSITGEPVAWVPYLSDRADGVKGHYAICRMHPNGYQEAWNLRSHRWASASDNVLTLDEALALMSKFSFRAAPVGSGEQRTSEAAPAEPAAIGSVIRMTGRYAGDGGYCGEFVSDRLLSTNQRLYIDPPVEAECRASSGQIWGSDPYNCAMYDMAYRNGLRAGYNLGVDENNEELQRRLADTSYLKVFKECRASSGQGNVAASSAPPTDDQSTRLDDGGAR